MKTSVRTLLLLLLLGFTASVTLTACGGGEEAEEPASDPVDPIPDDPDDAPPGTVNDLGLYVRVIDDDKYAHYMSKDGTFGSNCLVSSTATSSQDVECLVDILEGDLWFHGLKLNWNVPQDMCTYTKVSPYWYYNYETGTGPSAVTLDVSEVGSVKSVTACSVQTAQGAVAGCAGQDEVIINTADQSVSCIYDYSDSDGPNCCLGSYTLTKNITGDRVATEVSTVEWGGSYTGCIAGPGADSWAAKTSKGIPRSLVYWSEADGMNETWAINAARFKNAAYSGRIANYHGDLDHTHTGFIDVGTTSTAPYAVEPIDDRDGSPMVNGQVAYEFQCLDTAFEVKHRIKLYVREWNTYSQFVAYGASSGASGNANVGGVEDGADCSYAFGFACNDNWDWDDFLNWLDADLDVTTDTYDTTDPTLRGDYFPTEDTD